jgi:type I restriction enzyme R subunit
LTNKKALSESDICDRFITPAVAKAGWAANRWRREFGFTDGNIIVRGKLVARGKRKRVDYLLFHTPDLPIALFEAKDNSHSVGAGMQQALIYAEILNVPFVFSSNGDGFLFHDRTGTLPVIEQAITLDEFPSPRPSGRITRSGRGWTQRTDGDSSNVSVRETSGPPRRTGLLLGGRRLCLSGHP